MENKEFSLRIDCKEDGACIIFENDSTICNYRSEILRKVSSLDGTLVSRYDVLIPSREKMDNLLIFISSLKSMNIAITTNHGKNYLSHVKKTNYISLHWELINEHAVFYGGTPTSEGFNFQNPKNAYEFALYLVHLPK